MTNNAHRKSGRREKSDLLDPSSSKDYGTVLCHVRGGHPTQGVVLRACVVDGVWVGVQSMMSVPPSGA